MSIFEKQKLTLFIINYKWNLLGRKTMLALILCMTKRLFHMLFKKSYRLDIRLYYAAIFLRQGKISVIFIGFSVAQASIKQLNAPRNTLTILRSTE